MHSNTAGFSSTFFLNHNFSCHVMQCTHTRHTFFLMSRKKVFVCLVLPHSSVPYGFYMHGMADACSNLVLSKILSLFYIEQTGRISLGNPWYILAMKLSIALVGILGNLYRFQILLFFFEQPMTCPCIEKNRTECFAFLYFSCLVNSLIFVACVVLNVQGCSERLTFSDSQQENNLISIIQRKENIRQRDNSELGQPSRSK